MQRILRGAAVEAASVMTCMTRYPLGLLEASLRSGKPCGNPVYDTPVLLVHGMGHNRSGWIDLDRRLRRAGFTSVHTHNYRPTGPGVPALAAGLAHKVDAIRELTGADQVHVVGHSLGGLLLRWYVQELGGDAAVDTAITIASPHRGSLLARFGGWRVAADLRPGSAVLRRLDESARSSAVRWVAYWCNLDEFVIPASSARLDHPALGAENILVRNHGHISTLLSPFVHRSVLAHLEAASPPSDCRDAGTDTAAA